MSHEPRVVQIPIRVVLGIATLHVGLIVAVVVLSVHRFGSPAASPPPFNAEFTLPSKADTNDFFIASQGFVKIDPSNSHNFTGPIYGMAGRAADDGSGTISTMYGVKGGAHNGGHAVTNLGAVLAQAVNGGNAVTANMYGVDAQLSNDGTGTTTTAAALHAASLLNNGGGVVTNYYGLKVDDQTGATNNWAIKTGAGRVEFGDRVQLDAITDPGPPPANTGYLYLRKKQSGKMEIVARFSSGAAQVLATEP
jgi:hypothetical protein